MTVIAAAFAAATAAATVERSSEMVSMSGLARRAAMTCAKLLSVTPEIPSNAKSAIVSDGDAPTPDASAITPDTAEAIAANSAYVSTPLPDFASITSFIKPTSAVVLMTSSPSDA